MKWHVTDINEVVVLDVQQSVVRHTAWALLTLCFIFSCVLLYKSGMIVLERVFPLGKTLCWFSSFVNWRNPGSSTMEYGWKSRAIILANTSSKAFCLSGSIGPDTEWVSLACVPLALGLVAPAVATLAGPGPVLMAGAVQVALTGVVVVSLAWTVLAGAVLVLGSVGAGSCLTSCRWTVGCFVPKCRRRFALDPPLVDSFALQILHTAALSDM